MAQQLDSWALELEALEAIYADDLSHDEGSFDAAGLAALGCAQAPPPRPPQVSFSVRLDGGGAESGADGVLPPGQVRLHVRLTDGYPHRSSVPQFALLHQMLADVLPADGAEAVVRASKAAAHEAIVAGDTCVCYNAIAAANGAMGDGLWKGNGGASAGSPRPNAAAGDTESGTALPSGAEAHGDGCFEENDAATARTVRAMTVEAHAAVASLPPSALMGAMDDGSAKAEAFASLRGQWAYRVGLVGKPSAGKSSMFNALTRAGHVAAAYEEADGGTRVAAVGMAPFTTIAPNVGEARYAAPPGAEPASLVEARTPTAHGRADDGRRLLPCTLIDVAGLVPGAYLGKGRGNQFLADLCTADSLIHVVDASGMTDSGGNPTEAAYVSGRRGNDGAAAEGEEELSGAAEIASEIEWVSREIHLWVMTNLKAKRSTWQRRPERLVGMFTGYGCSPLMVEGVIRRAAAAAMADALDASSESGEDAVATSGQWRRGSTANDPSSLVARLAGECDVQLHRLVAHFVATRWPIAVALNKADAPEAATRIAACRKECADRLLVPTSARAELEALEGCEKAAKPLPPGATQPTLETLGALPPSMAAMARTWGSSGVLAVLSACVALRPPTLCYPVASLMSLAPLSGGEQAATSHSADETAAPLRDCLQLRPLSQVGDAFQVAKRAHLCAGDYVRAEALPASGREPSATSGSSRAGAVPVVRPLKKEDVVSPTCAIVRLQSTRKSRWQGSEPAAKR